MLHAVFDTNVLVSALIRRGKPRELWNLVLDRKVKLTISIELLAEFDDAIWRPEFERYVDKHRVVGFRRILLRNVKISRPTVRFSQLTDDPDDNMVVEAAHAAGAKYIVTGDKDLLDLKRFRKTKIITVGEVLRMLGKHR